MRLLLSYCWGIMVHPSKTFAVVYFFVSSLFVR